jgi:hypothetical protein
MTDCTPSAPFFQPLRRRDVVAHFDGGPVTADAGGLLLREVEAKFHFIDQFAECFTDHRDPDLKKGCWSSPRVRGAPGKKQRGSAWDGKARRRAEWPAYGRRIRVPRQPRTIQPGPVCHLIAIARHPRRLVRNRGYPPTSNGRNSPARKTEPVMTITSSGAAAARAVR